MALTNRERVQPGFELLRQGLIPDAEREFKKVTGPKWGFDTKTRSRACIDREQDGMIRWDTCWSLAGTSSTRTSISVATLAPSDFATCSTSSETQPPKDTRRQLVGRRQKHKSHRFRWLLRQTLLVRSTLAGFAWCAL